MDTELVGGYVMRNGQMYSWSMGMRAELAEVSSKKQHCMAVIVDVSYQKAKTDQDGCIVHTIDRLSSATIKINSQSHQLQVRKGNTYFLADCAPTSTGRKQ